MQRYCVRLRLVLPILAAVVLGAKPPAGAAESGLSTEGARGYGALTSPGPEAAPVLRIGLGTDYAQFDGTLYDGDGARQWRRRLALEAAPLPWISVAAQVRDLRTDNAFAEPHVVSVRGDALYSLKVARAFDAFSAGLLAQARAYVGGAAPAPSVYALGGYAAGDAEFALQTGWIVERPVALREGMSPVEAYAWQKPSFNAAAVRLAAAYDAGGWTPFIEVSSEIYAGAGLGFSEQPKRAVLGAHVSAGLPGLVFTPRVQAGTSARATSAVPTEPPWRAGLDVSYALALQPVWDALFPPPGRFTGVVTDAAHGYPLDAAVVHFGGRDFDVGADGLFTYDGRGGVFAVRIEAPGYLPVTTSATVAPGETRIERYGLLRNAGTVRGRVFLGDEATPGGATIRLINAALVFEADAATGLFSFDLPPDAYAFEVSAPGFLPEKRSFVVRLGKEVVFDRLVLKRAPKPRPIEVVPAKIIGEAATAPAAKAHATEPPAAELPAAKQPPVAKQPEVVEAPPKPPVVRPEVEAEQEQERRTWPPAAVPLPERLESPVFFEFGSWRLDPRGFAALDRLAELIRRDPSVARVVIEGRADVVGTEAANRYVAGKRADAVFEYLVSKGVPPAKLTTTSTVYTRRAVGQTDEQRAQDRRVGFRVER